MPRSCHRVYAYQVIAQAVFLLERGQTHRHIKSQTPLITLPTHQLLSAWPARTSLKRRARRKTLTQIQVNSQLQMIVNCTRYTAKYFTISELDSSATAAFMLSYSNTIVFYGIYTSVTSVSHRRLWCYKLNS